MKHFFNELISAGNRRKNFFLLLVVLVSSAMLQAQNISVSGIVKDSITGEPLSYVSVLFKNSTIGAMTDDNGAFSLQNDKGYTTLVVSSMGYTEKEIQSDGEVKYHLYYGYPSSTVLTDLEGNKKNRKDIMLDCLEAGEPAYMDRRHSYEILND